MSRQNPRHHHAPELGDPPYPLPAHIPAPYWPLPATEVPQADVKKQLNRLNAQTRFTHFIHHPPDSPIEYPETTPDLKTKIAHIVPITPGAFRNPRLSSQYSWKSRGTIENTACRILRGDNGHAQCYKTSFDCELF